MSLFGFTVFNADKILSGSVSYDDVPKYLPALSEFKSKGADDIAKRLLIEMLKTDHPQALLADIKLSGQPVLAHSSYHRLLSKADNNDLEAKLQWAFLVLLSYVDEGYLFFSSEDCEKALIFMQDAASSGRAQETHACVMYFLARINAGEGDHSENNKHLDYWLKTSSPKVYKKFQKGKFSQFETLNHCAKKCGFDLTSN
ncbi:hypothetical protein A3715_10200 [Oleiphilus sp. HI0009]|nr:hypothetical protein A3715_10200 [Oleiphilus sp. HI0009]